MLAHLRLMPHSEVDRKLREMRQHRWRFVFKVRPRLVELPLPCLVGWWLLASFRAACWLPPMLQRKSSRQARLQDQITDPPNAVNSLVRGICTGKSAT